MKAGKIRSRMGTSPLAENTIMKATSWSSMTRRDPITPPTTEFCSCCCRHSGFCCGATASFGSVRGATARVTPDIRFNSRFFQYDLVWSKKMKEQSIRLIWERESGIMKRGKDEGVKRQKDVGPS